MENSEPTTVWQPDADLVATCHLTRYVRWLSQSGYPEFGDYPSLWKWSAAHPDLFWESLWHYFSIQFEGSFESVMSEDSMPGVRWFEGARLNYAEHIFRQESAQRPALLYRDEASELKELSWATLRGQVAALTDFLKRQGIQPGDRVAGFLPNTPPAVVAVLACLSLGAVWTCCSPDFGVRSVADRFGQINPRILIAVDGYRYGGNVFDRTSTVLELADQLTSLECLVVVPHVSDAALLKAHPRAVDWEAILAASPDLRTIEFNRLPFAHPAWILYSSGTTGIPKAMVHSQGGNLLEHLKYLHFHNDVRPGERFFWYTTTGWMMWNFTLAALLAGATVVLYDGSPGYPDLYNLWQLAEQAGIHHFGTSAPYIIACRKAEVVPAQKHNLETLRSVGSTGSPLPPEGFTWISEALGKHVWPASMAGGTDVCTAWVGGNPLLPVYAGEIQSRCLGCAMESWDEDGKPVAVDEVGEMVVTKAMPSMPVHFWNDPGGLKYQASYFDYYAGQVWRHGDWIRLTPRDGIVISGRSDATLNRQGVRIGTAEIYRALDTIDCIRDALVLNLEKPDGTDHMPLFVLMKPGTPLDEAIRQQIKQTLRTNCSPRHVPDTIVEVPDIPYTISGKRMETPVKRILQKKSPEQAYNQDAMKNPASMDFFINYAESTT
jgi:acetoacetyl-CoA synthetase